MSKLLTKRPSKPKAPTAPKKYKAMSSTEMIYSTFLDGSVVQEILDTYNATLKDISFEFTGGDQYYSSNEIEITIDLPVLNPNYDKQMEAYHAKVEVYEKKLEVYREELKLWNAQKQERIEKKKAKEIADLERKLARLKKS